jgi:hypothetical protein
MSDELETPEAEFAASMAAAIRHSPGLDHSEAERIGQ